MSKKNISNTQSKVSVAFSALGAYVESRIADATESKSRNHDFVEWGKGNNYPQYLLSLFKSVASLRSVINGSTDYVVGDSITSEVPLLMGAVNDEGQTIGELIECIVTDYYIYGGYAIEVGRNPFGEIVSLRALDFSKLRTSKHNDIIYYSDDWSGYRVKHTQYQHFNPKHKEVEVSVLYEKNTHYQTYPEPIYVASLKACEVERAIDEYHLNAINNNFAASYIINFNNGQPTEEMKQEITEGISEKFTGQQNAGRVMTVFNDSAENAVTVQKLDIDNFGERYSALAKHCRQQIYTAFRANPNLFGIPTDNLGFSSEEYAESFKLYNRTQIRPVQAMIVDSFDKIFGMKGAISIEPFSIEDTKEEEVE